jgi:hypothetical protein
MSEAEEIGETPPRLGFRTLDEVRRSGDAGWDLVESAELADPERQRDVEQRLLPGEDTHALRIRRSWIWVDYAALVLWHVAARWALEGRWSDASAANAVAKLGDEEFEELVVKVERDGGQAQVRSNDPPPADLYHSSIDGHVAPVLQTAAARSRIGLRNLWGSVASGIVWSTGRICRQLEIEVPVRRLGAFLDGRPELADKGEIVRAEGAGPWAICLHRSTCCLWFRADPGNLCGNCVLASRDRVMAWVESADGTDS